MSNIDESMYRLTVQQRDQAWREIQFWQQKYDALLKTMTDSLHLRANPPMKLLANAESFEAGRAMEREACAKICDDRAKDFRKLLEKYGHEEDAGAAIGSSQCAELIRTRGLIRARGGQQ